MSEGGATERDRVRQAVRDLFAGDGDVVAVWGFGSFFGGGAYNDVDLAILFDGSLRPEECLRRSLETEGRLERAVSGKKFDVKALNGAPLFFQDLVVGRGDIVCANDEIAAVRFRAETWARFLDFKPAWERSNRRLAESFLHG